VKLLLFVKNPITLSTYALSSSSNSRESLSLSALRSNFSYVGTPLGNSTLEPYPIASVSSFKIASS